MKAVWKFPFVVNDRVTIAMPEGARILHVAQQPRNTAYRATIWAEVETDADEVERTFYVVGTGHPMGDVGTYVGTIVTPFLVWHVYEEPTHD